MDFGALCGDLCEAVDECAVPVTVIRSYPGAVVKGRAQPKTVERFHASLSVQPMTGRELQQVPEGERAEERVKAFSCTELHTTKTSECRTADQFLWKGRTYRIVRSECWEAGGFYRYEAVGVDA